MTIERGNILVTPRSLTKDGPDADLLAPLRRAGYRVVTAVPGQSPTADELRNLLPGVVGWLAGVEAITADVLDAGPDLRVISRNGTGTDSIDLAATDARGIRVERAIGANAQGVAELAVSLALTAQRGIPWANDSVKDGGWQRDMGREFADTTVGIIGLGAIGVEVARLFTALGCRVRGFDPFAQGSPFAVTSLDEVFADADVVSLHAPAPADGRPLVDEALLRLVRPGSVLVNTARSALVDDDAVLAALGDGRLGAYAVDAFDTEPPTLTALLRHPRTLTTPHIGGYTTSSIRRATDVAITNLLNALESLAPQKETA